MIWRIWRLPDHAGAIQNELGLSFGQLDSTEKEITMLKTPFFSKTMSAGIALASSTMLVACGADSGIETASRNDSSDPVSKQVTGPLDPVQEMLVQELLIDQLGGAMPTPMNTATNCLATALNSLLDGPDSLMLALTSVGEGADPVSSFQGSSEQLQASLNQFSGQMQAGLGMLTGTPTPCDVAGGNTVSLSGTPLEPAGEALEQLQAALAGGDNDDQDLKPVTDALAPALQELSTALSQLPSELTGAPVLGGIFLGLETAISDLGVLLPAVGSYDPAGTQAGMEVLLNNLMGNLLLNTLPVSEIDDLTGQDFSGQIQDGIDQATAAFGSGVGQLITPIFNEALNGALEPVLDPVEGLLAQLLGELGNPGANPLDGLLGTLARDGKASPLDALLLMLIAGAGDSPLGDITDALTAPGARDLLEALSLMAGQNMALDELLARIANASGDTNLLEDVLEGLLG